MWNTTHVNPLTAKTKVPKHNCFGTFGLQVPQQIAPSLILETYGFKVPDSVDGVDHLTGAPGARHLDGNVPETIRQGELDGDLCPVGSAAGPTSRAVSFGVSSHQFTTTFSVSPTGHRIHLSERPENDRGALSASTANSHGTQPTRSPLGKLPCQCSDNARA